MSIGMGLLPKGRPRFCHGCGYKSSVSIVTHNNRTYPICDNGHDFTDEWNLAQERYYMENKKNVENEGRRERGKHD